MHVPELHFALRNPIGKGDGVTEPLLPSTVTARVYTFLLNFALAERSFVSVTVQVEFIPAEAHAPDQPAKSDEASGVAVIVTTVSRGYLP